MTGLTKRGNLARSVLVYPGVDALNWPSERGRSRIMTLDKTIKYAGLAIAGGAIGAAIGILVAPASGAETRRKISDRIDAERNEFLKKMRRDPRSEDGYPYSVISA